LAPGEKRAISIFLKSKLSDAERIVLAERNFGTDRAVGGQGHGLVDRELPLGQNLQDFAPDIAGGADHGDTIAHGDVLGSSLERGATILLRPARHR
jgi:hypothetical protein